MNDFFGYISVLLVDSSILKGLALNWASIS